MNNALRQLLTRGFAFHPQTDYCWRMDKGYFADVLVQKSGRATTFTYTIPTNLTSKISPGLVVKVPLRGRKAIGVVMQIKPYAVRGIKNIKAINTVIDADLKLTSLQLNLALWMSDYFVAPLNACVFSFLPILQGRSTLEIKSDEIKTRPDGTKNDLTLSDEQSKALDVITKSAKPVLLHGVTGSGKTEIYLRRAETILQSGGQVLILVPEIALTPQTLKRFTERFGTSVAAWHSELKSSERRSVWWGVRDQHIKLIVGSRSAIFLPFQNLKLIVIDEEHEHTYFQESAPRYDARTLAVEMSQRANLQLIFGSATPSLERVWQASTGQIELAVIKSRVSARPTPETTLVDLREEPTNQSLLSGPLANAILDTLASGRQTVILLNRRGHASSALCKTCGFILLCKNCDIPLTVHDAALNVNVQCHHCDFKAPVPPVCPKCRAETLEYRGFGTERVATALSKQFPSARVLRMDRDSTSERATIDHMYHDFAARKFDILIGTQMIAKGWDVPSVDLVGVLLAESGLFLPDYHSSANTFNLLVQVAGRSGRGEIKGRTIIQTYNPDSDLIRAVALHDFGTFAKRELKQRRQFNYPPFSSIVRFVFQHVDRQMCLAETTKIAKLLNARVKNAADHILGPTPCYFERLLGKHRWHIICKLNDADEIAAVKAIGQSLASPWIVEVNPGQLL